MTSADKALIICLIGTILGFILIILDVQRSSYNKGVRDGWHRGRAMSRQEFWEE